MTIPTVTLNNGTEIPQLGFGVFQIKPEETAVAVRRALGFGYRHIDTAQMYLNEEGVGQGIRDSGVDPADIWITSKIGNRAHGYDNTLRALDRSLNDLGVNRIDMMLIHWPLPSVGDFVATWKALEVAYAQHRTRAIGVSNFHPNHLLQLFTATATVPAVNQLEVHPYLTQNALMTFNREHGIATQSYSPLAQGKVLTDPTITALADKYGRSPAQVVLRWHIQRNCIIFPRSVSPARIQQNLHIFDFDLTDDDVSRLSGLNRDERIGRDPDDVDERAMLAPQPVQCRPDPRQRRPD